MSEAEKTVGKLFTDLKSELDAEHLYWVRNDAKLKAVVTSKSYEEFRDTVDAAHLIGISKADFKKKSTLSWNKSVNK